MKVVSISGKKQLSVVETEMPKGDGEKVVIKVSAAAICGSDLHMWESGKAIGLVMGHEFCGTVVDPGALKGAVSSGERVTVIPLNPCGKCESCRNGQESSCSEGWNNAPGLDAPGGFSEYTSVFPGMIKKIPDTISDMEGAMIEPAAVTLHAVRLSGIKVGDKVLITGAGIIGLLCAAWARMAGASYIAMTEINPIRREFALKMGDVDEVFDAKNPEMVNQLIEASGGGFDRALDCAGVEPAVNTALRVVKPGGKVTLVGISFAPVSTRTVLVVTRELTVNGSNAYTHTDFDLCIDAISSKKIELERFVSSETGFAGIQDAFERLISENNPDAKIVFKPM